MTDRERTVLRVALEHYLSHVRDKAYFGDPGALITSGTDVTYRDAEEIVQDLIEGAK